VLQTNAALQTVAHVFSVQASASADAAELARLLSPPRAVDRCKTGLFVALASESPARLS
jgi:hypothetical protein